LSVSMLPSPTKAPVRNSGALSVNCFIHLFMLQPIERYNQNPPHPAGESVSLETRNTVVR
jgi:hypothetical protein